MGKIMTGYGGLSGRKDSTRKNLYGKQRQGKLKTNGGFSFEPTIGYETISDDRWVEIFGNKHLPTWKKELIAKGELLDE